MRTFGLFCGITVLIACSQATVPSSIPRLIPLPVEPISAIAKGVTFLKKKAPLIGLAGVGGLGGLAGLAGLAGLKGKKKGNDDLLLAAVPVPSAPHMTEYSAPAPQTYSAQGSYAAPPAYSAPATYGSQMSAGYDNYESISGYGPEAVMAPQAAAFASQAAFASMPKELGKHHGFKHSSMGAFKKQPQVPSAIMFAAPSQSFSAPSAPAYQPAAQSYAAPQQVYAEPQPVYSAPAAAPAPYMPEQSYPQYPSEPVRQAYQAAPAY